MNLWTWLRTGCAHRRPMLDVIDGVTCYRCAHCLHTWPMPTVAAGVWRPEIAHQRAKRKAQKARPRLVKVG